MAMNPSSALLESARKASSGVPLKGDFERMARRRFQNPTPFREGHFWWILTRVDTFENGRFGRKRKRVPLGSAKLSQNEAKRLAVEHVRPTNLAFQSIGAAIPFGVYVQGDYTQAVLPRYSKPVRSNYEYHLKKHLLPTFTDRALSEMTNIALQKYFNTMADNPAINRATLLKVKDVLASVFVSAMDYGLLSNNPLKLVRMPNPKVGKRQKPHITPVQFAALLELVAEPYATMIYVCVFAGLRVSELIGLKWEDVQPGSLTIDERFCRGDWSCPKTSGSSATIGVDCRVTDRIAQLKDVTVSINWGANGARKAFKVVRSDGPSDLVFQSLRTGAPMSDHNILSRHIKPAGEKLGIRWVNWQVLRRSYITWMVQAGADPKAVQAQARHSRSSTTMDVYAQFVPENQQRAVQKMMEMFDSSGKVVQ